MIQNRKAETSSFIHQSLVRCCGGGIPNRSECKAVNSPSPSLSDIIGPTIGSGDATSTNGNTHSNLNSNDQWIQYLKSLVEDTISFPNGEDNDFNMIGKPHNIESRIALTLFHRHKCKKNQNQRARKYKKTKRCNENHPSSNSEKSCPIDTDLDIIDSPPMTVQSDLGCIRPIYSPIELAKLLVRDMEEALWRLRVDHHNEESDENCAAQSDYKSNDDVRVNTKIADPFLESCINGHCSVGVDKSGIICLVTSTRIAYLKSINRFPCSYCIKWCKGKKGLWWHEQMEHGIDHSSAVSKAASSHGFNDKALVLYKPVTSDVLPPVVLPVSDMNAITKTENPEQYTVQSMKMIDQNTFNKDAFFELVKKGDLTTFRSFINQNSCLNEYDIRTILDKNGAGAMHWAAGCGHLPVVKYLVEDCRFPANQPQAGNAKRSFLGRTPLHWSSRNGHLPVVRYLVEECKVDKDAVTSDGTTAFCWSCWQGHDEIMRYLFVSGANISIKNSFGCNAALWYSQSSACELDTIQWLNSVLGCQMWCVNHNGHTMLHKASQRGNKEICRWIISCRCTFLGILRMDKDKFSKDLTSIESKEFDSILQLISPDDELNCPSDLAGAAGHEILAEWLSEKEKDIATASYMHNHLKIPEWLVDGISEARHLHNRTGLQGLWESGAGIRKISFHIVQYAGGNTSQ